MPDPVPDLGPLLGTVYCCREWIVLIGAPVGKCGLCGERPIPR